MTRRLRIVWSASKGALPAIVMASVLPSESCGGKSETLGDVTGSGAVGGIPADAAGESGGSGGSLAGGAGGVGGVIDPSGGSGGEAGAGGSGALPNGCPSSTWIETEIVELPPEGVPADALQICSVSADPVESNRAARVTLTRYTPALELAQGFVELAPALSGRVVGLPTISVLDASSSLLSSMQVSEITALPGGYSFHAEWPDSLQGLVPNGYARMTLKTSFDLACVDDGGPERRVESLTHVHLCIGREEGVEWASSGDTCMICRVIAEMAPSPIVPDKTADSLPLARAVRLRLVVVARIGQCLVLFAENDGGPGMSYEWRAAGGTLEELAPDVVLWRMDAESEGQFLQAAVYGDAGAAVATWSAEQAA
jgi:hypothetical protein